ncbi:MAG: alpha/beta fold hydrolase [Gemmatimonadota bacterium]|nr:alpha/beta fold hydrolase [Gemmatimonadota bacterium]
MDTKLHVLVRILLGGLALYVFYGAVLFFAQRRFIFPRHLVRTPPMDATDTSGIERIWLTTNAGRTETWLLPPDSAASPTPAIIVAHGNAELIDHWVGETAALRRLGFAVLLVEYPGYGRSEGSPTQASVTEAFVAAYDMLAARDGVDADRIVFLGRSLGGGAVCALAAERPPAALVLISTFKSVNAMAVEKFFVPPFFARDPFNNLKTLRNYPGAVLIAHGTRDNLIPYSHGVALREASRRGRLVTYEAGHNNCPPDWQAFWAEVERFMREEGILP